MDELYLEWLIAKGGLDREVAKSISRKFSSLEELVDATPEAIAEASGVSVENARILRSKASDSLLAGTESLTIDKGLFLCPECGAFVSPQANKCPQCGSYFEGAEIRAEPEEKGKEEEPEETTELYICTSCGAFLTKDVKKCPTCGRLVEEEEAAEQERQRRELEEAKERELRVCSWCGAFLASDAVRCGICGQPLEEEKPIELEAEREEVEAREPRGVSKDFLKRWQRVAEKAPSREQQLVEELRHYDELLRVDPKLEKAWVLRSHVLRELGRAKEAANCLEKAAQINPAREEEYRLQVLNIAETFADSSVVPPKWSAIVPPEKPARELAAVNRALSYYDLLLRSQPNLEVAWETRAELLRRLGRDTEAEISLARAKEVRDARSEVERKALEGLRAIGTPRLRIEPKEGRINGLVNGIGRVNGLINGTGRVNGIIIGRVNGLVTGVGRINGLVNGDGFVNGRRGRYPPTSRPERGWIRSAGILAAVVSMLLLAPVIASLLTPSPVVPAFTVDGSFSEWQGVPPHPDRLLDTKWTNASVQYLPELDLVTTRIAQQYNQIVMYAKVNGQFFSTSDEATRPSSADYLIAMIDTDGRSSTGYKIGGIGADIQARVSGWHGEIAHSYALQWDSKLGGGQNNASAFVMKSDIPSAVTYDQLEFMVPTARPREATVVFLTANVTGEVDISDDILMPDTATLLVSQRTLVGDITASVEVPVLSIDLRANAGNCLVYGVNLSKSGSMPDGDIRLDLYQDNGDGTYSSSDALLDSSNVTTGEASFATNMEVPEGQRSTLFVVANFTDAPQESSLKLSISEVESNSLYDLRDAQITGTYLLGAPGVTIDGEFGDWDKSKLQKDAQWDVRSVDSSLSVNQNVDIAEVGVNVTSEFAFYMKVHGRMLGGEDMPNLAVRPGKPTYADSDMDTVPDIEDPCPSDFNNDNVSDEATNHDVDGDGLADYPWGLDFWLNTTIPGWFPLAYAGRIVSIYIGPIRYNVPTGVDFAYAYIDADNSSATGLYVILDGDTYGVDYALMASGREGHLDNASLYRYASASYIPFKWVRQISSAVDFNRLELGLNMTLLGLQPDFRVFAFAVDWLRDSDNVAPIRTRGGHYGSRTPAGDNAVLNEISPRKPTAWVELCNPTSSSISLNGWTIQVQKGNKYITLYTFGNVAIGAWLSGTEYLAVDVPTKDLPNANGVIVLRDASGNIVDSTTYSAVGSGETWSRFKAPTDGKPVDTDQGADWYVSRIPSRGGPNDRTRPIIRVAKTASTANAQPGDLITYTIYYNNTGDGQSRRVWINDTIPADVTFYSSSVPPSSSNGRTYRWIFTNVTQSSQGSFTVTVRVSATAGNGVSEVNMAALNYTDQLFRRMETSGAWANFTVRRPVIAVQKTASPSVSAPGSIITYTIYFNNSGSISAGTVWINDTLPSDVTFVGSSVPPSSSNGQIYRWIFTNVAVGAHSFTITVRVNANPTSSVLVNWVFLNYTSANGFKLEESRASARVMIPEFQDVVAPIAVPLLVVIGLNLLRRKKGRGSGRQRSTD